MKCNIKHLFFLLVALAGMSSCVSHSSLNRTYFKPDEVRLEMSMQDLEYVGQVTVETEYKRYFGMFTKILTVNGEAYDQRTYTVSRLAVQPDVRSSKYIKKALYKVVDTYPDADYTIPTFYKKEVEHMFGGRIIKESMTIKVYRLKK